MKKAKWIAGLLALCIALNALAWVQYVAPVSTAVMWLGRAAANNINLVRATEVSITAHGAAAWAWYVWKNKNDTTSETSSRINARLVVAPSTTAKRTNPDSTKFDDATSTRDPTPKAIYPHSQKPPGNGSLYAIARAGVGRFTYTSNKGETVTEYDVIQTYDSELPQAHADSAAKSKTASAHVGWYWSDGHFIDSKDWRAIWYITRSNPTCPAGYVYSAGFCKLTNPAAVMKPAKRVPCEVLANEDGTWDIDKKNPECTEISNQLKRSGNKLYVSRGDGANDVIENKSDGGTVITTGNRTIEMSPPDSEGRQTIISITDAGSGTTTGGTIATSGPSAPNGPSGTGSTGDGDAKCGGAGQSPCAVTVDDSGFQGKESDINSSADAINEKHNERKTFIESKGSEVSNFGLDTSWIPSLVPGSPVTCSELKWEPGISHGPLASLSGSIDIDWCSKIDFIREYYAWLVGVITVWAIAMLFFTSNGNAGRTGK